MNTEAMDRNGREDADRSSTAEKPLACESIQAVLFDYLSRELGAARSDLVREHLRRCLECRKAAADMQATVELLRTASREERGVPTALSDARRRRLRRVLLHPVLDWMDSHQVVTSLLAALVALAAVLWLLIHVRGERVDPPEAGPTVFYGGAVAPDELPSPVRPRPREGALTTP